MGVLVPKEIEELGRFYDIEMSAGEYLASNDHLIPFLIEMAPVLGGYFPNCPLRIHLERDPETGREEDLWALAMWHDTENWRVASESLDRFRREWWFERSPRVARQLAVNFEFAEVEVAA
ncbi:MAG TPA: hypothetical protein VF627_14640 [Abditibacterium sp.]